MTRDILCLLSNFKFLISLIRPIIQAHLSAFSNKNFYNEFVTVYYRHCATSRTASGSILGIFTVTTEGTMCPGVDSASKNEYQGFLLR
jgi:hypothetical protein